jgi:2-octaprenyl-6-methoxyphenol hydroxylase
MRQFDLVISGGGPVGLVLALATAKNRRVCVVEPNPFGGDVDKENTSFDGRVLALSERSVALLKKVGVWTSLKPFVTAIEHVHVSQKGYLGLTKLHADEVGVKALGYSIRAEDLGRELWSCLANQESIEVVKGRVLGFEDQEHNVLMTVNVEGEKSLELSSQLVIGADGTYSQIRQSMGLELIEKSYDAFGILAQVSTRQPHQGWSFERFTQEGPVALLPVAQHHHKAVMVVPASEVTHVMSLNDQDFLRKFEGKIGRRFGGYFDCSPRVSYPLKESYVETIVKGHAILMGNAAHTQHPVAAQGLNLGLSDVEAFIKKFETLLVEPSFSLRDKEKLEAYEKERKAHHKKVMGLTDGLITLFQHPSPLVGHLRGLGLMAMQALPFVRKRFTLKGMGR